MPRGRVTWSQVGEGFYVGSRASGLVGYVDRRSDGAFTAFDVNSHIVGNFGTLADAMAALAETATAATHSGVNDG